MADEVVKTTETEEKPFDPVEHRRQMHEKMGVPMPDRKVDDDPGEDIEEVEENEDVGEEPGSDDAGEEIEVEDVGDDLHDDDTEDPDDETEDDEESEEDETEETEDDDESLDDLEDFDEDETEDEEDESEDTDFEDVENFDDLDEEGKTNVLLQLKKVGREKKELSRQLQLAEENLTKKEVEFDEVVAELDTFKTVKIDPTSHPEFVELKKTTGESIYSNVLEALGEQSANRIDNQWGTLITTASDYRNAPREKKAETLKSFHLDIAKTLRLVDDSHAELDPEVDTDILREVKKVSAVFMSHTEDYQKMSQLYVDIQSKAGAKSLEIGYKDYQESTKTVRERLALINTLDDKAIEDDPSSLQSLAARKIQGSPELRKKAEIIDKYLLEMGFGPEALSQEEIDRHLATGKDMTEFEKSRRQRVADFRNDRMPLIKTLLVLLPDIKKALPEHFKTDEETEKKRTKKKVVRKASKKAKVKEVKDEEEVVTAETLKAKMRESLNA